LVLREQHLLTTIMNGGLRNAAWPVLSGRERLM
jgi:hypothetical protein